MGCIVKDAIIENAAADTDLEPDQYFTIYNDDKVRLTKYYGLVPRDFLEAEVVIDDDNDSKFVEALLSLLMVALF